MPTPPPPSPAEIQSLLRAYAALNRGDIDAFVSIFDPGIERSEFLGSPHGGTYRGIEAVRAHVVKGRGGWAEGACEPRRFIVADDRVIVLVHVRVRLKSETLWREGDVGDVYTFRGGKAIEFRTFAEQTEALAWAGVEDALEG